VNKPKFVETAWTRRADAIILDLEDPYRGGEATRGPGARQDSDCREGARVIVRVNKDQIEDDLEASVWPGLACVMLPRQTAAELWALDGAGRLERESLARAAYRSRC
jgi:citrate lyase beta subunit